MSAGHKQYGQFCLLATTVLQAVKNVLSQAYGRKEAVTDELVDAILKPGLQPGAVHVFLDFISYSGGPVSFIHSELLPL